MISDTLGRSITDFCANQYTQSEINHCAHFVCHMLEFDAGYDCRTATMAKKAPGVGVRVQELFAACPVVGRWADHPAAPCLVFVTDASNVNLATHTMRNVPKKHVGIFDGTHVYNYSNGQDEVVRQTPPDFLTRFQGTYGGNQALFFGTIPAGAVVPVIGAAIVAPPVVASSAAGTSPVAPPPPVVAPPAVPPAHAVAIREATTGSKTDHFATVDAGAEFFVGRGVSYKKLRGLYQDPKVYGPQYAAADYMDRYESAAALVGVIATSESALYFNRINTYDRAAFTYGFFQLAAHTPNDNLILLFRQLVGESPGFREMFPDLSVRDGKLHRQVGPAAWVSLEKAYIRNTDPTDTILKDFMAYLNPDGSKVDARELDAAARLVWLANEDPGVNDIQVNTAVTITMEKLRRIYDPRYNLDGVSDIICTAIADIHHQGRASKSAVRTALASGTIAQKTAALCKLGETAYPERCKSLRKALRDAKGRGELGNHVYDRASGLFRPGMGWVD